MIVLDVSAAMAMARQTGEGQALEALMLEGEKVIAPRFYLIEGANVVWKCVRAGVLPPTDASTVLAGLAMLVDEFVEDGELIEEALAESIRCNHPIYDMMYLVLTRRRGATLFTLDKRLAGLCAECRISCVEVCSI